MHNLHGAGCVATERALSSPAPNSKVGTEVEHGYNTINHQYLLHGADRRASDMHVRSGYPIWNIIADWIARHRSDKAVIQDYQLDPAEWAAAKQYYLDHRAVIDARIILNQEPFDHEIEPGLTTPDDFFAWAERTSAARAQG